MSFPFHRVKISYCLGQRAWPIGICLFFPSPGGTGEQFGINCSKCYFSLFFLYISLLFIQSKLGPEDFSSRLLLVFHLLQFISLQQTSLNPVSKGRSWTRKCIKQERNVQINNQEAKVQSKPKHGIRIDLNKQPQKNGSPSCFSLERRWKRRHLLHAHGTSCYSFQHQR